MATKNYRIEKDSLGEVKVPKKALWGAQTQRAVDNFPISGIKMDFPFTKSFVSSLGLIKDAAARANSKLKLLPANKARAISKASKEVWQEKHHHEFPIDVFQTGSGTSSNMNANEVIGMLTLLEKNFPIKSNRIGPSLLTVSRRHFSCQFNFNCAFGSYQIIFLHPKVPRETIVVSV